MKQNFSPHLEEKAWLFHRGKWSRIKNPIYRKGSLGSSAYPGRQTFRRILREYNLRWWILGPEFLLPYYTGTLVYTYSRDVEEQGPEFLILIDTNGPVCIIFAQDLPDLLNVLALLAPIVNVDILVDIYTKGMNAYKENQNTK